jgi:hypothetical protein
MRLGNAYGETQTHTTGGELGTGDRRPKSDVPTSRRRMYADATPEQARDEPSTWSLLHIVDPIYLISLRGTMALSADMRSLEWCDRRARCGVLGTYGVFDETIYN